MIERQLDREVVRQRCSQIERLLDREVVRQRGSQIEIDFQKDERHGVIDNIQEERQKERERERERKSKEHFA